MKSWSLALSYAPFVVGLMACGSSSDGPASMPDASSDDAGAPQMDASVVADAGSRDGGSSDCQYPAGAVEPMARNEVFTPYSWPQAFDGTGRAIDLSLADAHCNTDDDIDWSPFDLLLFVSIPAW
ncbi:MAG: hypothetical protein AAFN74_10750 [Myxococcota bacterium]